MIYNVFLIGIFLAVCLLIYGTLALIGKYEQNINKFSDRVDDLWHRVQHLEDLIIKESTPPREHKVSCDVNCESCGAQYQINKSNLGALTFCPICRSGNRINKEITSF